MIFKTRFIVLTLLIALFWQCQRKTKGHFEGGDHYLSDSTLIVLVDSISPDSNFRYITYKFDNGGFGYSRVFWTVFENTDKTKNLADTKIPDGYKITGWSKDNELILEKWEPYYFKDEDIEFKTGSEFNGIRLIIK
jgi:hypothetical protein